LTTLSKVRAGLSDCLDLSARLNTALEDGVSALVGCDYERLAQLAPEQEKLAFALRRRERELRAQLAALSREVGFSGEIKLQPLLAAAAAQFGDWQSDELLALARKLRDSTARTSELTITNKALLASLNTYVSAVFKLLLGVEEAAGYGGPVGETPQRHLVDQHL